MSSILHCLTFLLLAGSNHAAQSRQPGGSLDNPPSAPTVCNVDVPSFTVKAGEVTDAQQFLDRSMAPAEYAEVVDTDVRRAVDDLGPRRRSPCHEDTYGELTPRGAQALFGHPAVHLGPEDVFYDLGSGFGRLVAEAAVVGGARKAVGVELSKDRHDLACAGIRNVAKSLKGASPDKPTSRHLQARLGNVVDADVSDATVVYVACTCFRSELIAEIGSHLSKQLPKGARVATLRKFPSKQGRLGASKDLKRLAFVGSTKAEMSWGVQTIYLYHAE